MQNFLGIMLYYSRISILITLLILVLNQHILLAQKIIQGVIKDEQTLKSLPAANIQIEGTFKGTISNDDGKYILKLEEVPATIIISYIGYATYKRKITAGSSNRQDIFLTPISYELEPIIVTDEDPAVRIMREVIKRKKQWRATLNSYQADAYTRMVLENDTSITSIMESISKAYWDKERGVRELVKSKRQTSNLTAEQNFANAAIISNLYDDDIEIAGFKIIGVTHPDALTYYDFKLENQRQRDNKIVFDISVKPKSKLQPTFIGQISVLDEEYALLDVDLQPSEAVLFPIPIRDFNLHYKQQFNNFGGEYWLPVDVRVTGSIKIEFIGLKFPSIIIKRITRLTDYRINVPLPDSLYKQEQLWVNDSTSINQDADSVFAENPDVVPFSKEEEIAYTKLDSTMTLVKAYRPSGLLAKFVEVEEGDNNKSKKENHQRKLFSNITPIITYNRVDEATLGLRKTVNFLKKQSISVFGGYKTGQDRWFFGSELDLKFGKKGKWRGKLQFFHNSNTRYSSMTYPKLFTSIHTLLGYYDYFDYYWNRQLKLSLGYAIPQIDSHISLNLTGEIHGSLSKSTDYNILGRNITQRENPAITEGNLRSIQFEWIVGENYIPFGVIGQNWVKFSVEHSSPDLFSSDFDFTRYQIALVLRIKTLLQRRLLPNVLDLQFVGGTFKGQLPIQRYSIIDGALQIFGPFATLKSLIGKPYEGEKYLAIFWEHNFRTVPFELLGWRSLAKKHISIILHGASGRTWISNESFNKINYLTSYQDHFHHEIGISVSGIFQFFRLDITRRLDRPETYVGVSAARLF